MMNQVMICATIRFMEKTCARPLLTELQTAMAENYDFSSIYMAGNRLGCNMPDKFELPDNYTVGMPAACAVVNECDTMSGKECIAGLTDLDSGTCG